MDPFSLDIVNQAITNLFIGFGLALVNVIVRYFAPFVPHVITILRWRNLKRALIAAYLIALVLQLVTSPFFRSLIHPTSLELAWSPYQAVWNVLGVIIMDLILSAWSGVRRGGAAGRKQLDTVKARAAEGLDELGVSIPVTEEQRAAQEVHRKAAEEAEAKALAERKQRLDDQLKYY